MLNEKTTTNELPIQITNALIVDINLKMKNEFLENADNCLRYSIATEVIVSFFVCQYIRFIFLCDMMLRLNVKLGEIVEAYLTHG